MFAEDFQKVADFGEDLSSNNTKKRLLGTFFVPRSASVRVLYFCEVNYVARIMKKYYT